MARRREPPAFEPLPATPGMTMSCPLCQREITSFPCEHCDNDWHCAAIIRNKDAATSSDT